MWIESENCINYFKPKKNNKIGLLSENKISSVIRYNNKMEYKGKEFNVAEAYEKAGKSKNTIYTYSSMIRRILKELKTNKIDKLVEEPQEVCKTIKEMSNNNTSKTIASALVILMDGIDKDTADIYRDCMMDGIKKHREQEESQKMTEKQKENWMEWSEVLETYKKLEKEAKALLKKDTLNSKDLLNIQNWVILALYTLIPPRRIMDYALLRWSPSDREDKDSENYVDMKRKKLVFNIYKTASKYGKEEIDIPKELLSVLKKWKSVVGDRPFVLFNGNDKPLAQSELTVKINKIFGKNVSASMLRHIYLTNLYKDMPALKEMKENARKMGHSVSQAMEYVKNV
jgi:integrase